MKEIWKKIEESDFNMISNLGNVKRMAFNYTYTCDNTKSGIRQISGKEIMRKRKVSTDGLYRASYYKTQKQTTFLVHRMVAKYFVDNPNKHEQVMFKDGNKLNVRCDNLVWVKYNTAVDYTSRKPHYKTIPDIEVSKIKKSKLLQKELAEKYNVRDSTISNIKRGINRKKVYVEPI